MKKKVLFVAQKMSVGGIESSLVNLLNVISRRCREEYDITLFTFTGGRLLEKIPPEVSVTTGSKGLRLIADSFKEVVARKNFFDTARRLYYMAYAKLFGSDRLYRKLLKKHTMTQKYDIAISYFNDITTVRFSRGTNMFVSDFVCADSKIAWVHTDPVHCRFDREYCRGIYKNFDRIVCVSAAIKEKMDALVPEYSNKTEVIHNVFLEDEIIEKAAGDCPFEKGSFDIVTVGRVDNSSKRMDGIVRLCRRLKDEGVSEFKWRIVGGGSDLERNVSLANELGVSDVVEFVGERDNPYPYIKNSDVFALYSAYEGFPMVIGEARILKTKIITTEYAAAREQISENQGTICKNDEEFYSSLKAMILEK